MGHRATRRKARQGLVSLKKGSGNVKGRTYVDDRPVSILRIPNGMSVQEGHQDPDRHVKIIRYNPTRQEVKAVITLREARQESTVPNPKVHKGKIWKTGYRSKTTEMALCPTRSSPLSTGRWAIARPIRSHDVHGATQVRRYETYEQACFWRDRLNRLLRRKHNLWYTIVDMS